jgi:hypothetical protein
LRLQIARLVNMVSSKSQQCHGPALALLLMAGLSQSMAFRAHVSKEDGEFVPLTRPSRAAVADSERRSDVANPQVGTFGVGGKATSYTSYRQALSSLRMNADSTTEGGASMQSVATTALDSAGDPSKVAAEMENLSAEDKKVVEKMTTDMKTKAQTLPGIAGPLGFFDPVGFCNQATEGRLCFYREVEVKHGRLAMLASLGFLVGEQYHPLFGGEVDTPSYLAFQQTPLQTFWPAVVAALAIPETFSILTFNNPTEPDGLWTVQKDREGGDLGFDPLSIKPENPKKFKEMQTKELNNGRLAMLAAAGMVAQELVTGEKLFPDGLPVR